MKKVLLILSLMTAILLVNGCENLFAPGLTNQAPNTNQFLTEQKTAEEVLVNLSYAYNFKDSLVYADLLDSSFKFIFTDFTKDPVLQDNWGRDVDIKTTMGLFRHFETVNLVWDGTIEDRFENEEKTEKTIWKSFKLTLDSGIELSTVSGEAIFSFKKFLINPPDTASVWRITKWIDRQSF